MSEIHCRRFMLAIETDATRYHGSSPERPKLLNKTDSEQLLAHIKTDLATLLPKTSACKLITVGALFDQTQVLRPAYPVFSALEKLVTKSDMTDSPTSIALAADQGRIPFSGLQPEEDIPLGILQILPVVICGKGELIDELAEKMEHRFLEEGQLSAHSARWLESAFAIKINHVRFMTVMDLNAMFRLQMEHFGFLPLWTMIDAALNRVKEPLEVSLEDGQVYQWKEGAVHTQYQTFDYWSIHGGGKEIDFKRGSLAGSYADWTQKIRQLVTVLDAHHVPLQFHLPGQADDMLKKSYFIEESEQYKTVDVAEITEHSFADLGVICVSVIHDGKQANYYPLRSEGLNDIHAAIRNSGPSGRTVAFPGTILFDESTRMLQGES